MDEWRNFIVQLTPLPDSKLEEKELESMLLRLKRDLIDFNLRDIVAKETRTVRELLIAKAFSSFDTEEPPPGSEESQ